MVKLSEIENTLPQLSTKDLQQIEATIHKIYRERNISIIYDDEYGVWTEEDQSSVSSEVLDIIEDNSNEFSETR